MSTELFSHREYGDNASDKAAILVAGFMGHIADLEEAALTLSDHDFNVFAYEFSPSVLTEGNPTLLPQIVNEISDDFFARTDKYTTIQPAGVSIGAGIAWESQKRDTERVLPGVYAAAGANSADGIFGYNPVMFPLRRAFSRNGHHHTELKELWTEIHTPPITGFTIALGGLDYIVRHPHIMKKIRGWREDGIPIKTRTLWHLSHTGTIRWYDRNLDVLLDEK